MKKIGLLAAAFALVAGVTLSIFHPALAGTTKKNVTGKVTGVSTSSITVEPTGAAEVVYVVTSTTKVFAKNGGKETMGLVSVGDTVSIEGTQTSLIKNINGADRTLYTYTATKITDKSIWRAKTQGSITDLNADAMTFNLTISRKVEELGVNATYSASNAGNSLTRIRQATSTKSGNTRTITTATMAWTDLANGQVVGVAGLWNSAKKVMTDSLITMPTINK